MWKHLFSKYIQLVSNAEKSNKEVEKAYRIQSKFHLRFPSTGVFLFQSCEDVK